MSFDPVYAISFIACLLFSLTIHEAAHAYAAVRLGDDTPENEGRLTLNPISHIELFGTILLPMFLILSGSGLLFGWAKPVLTNPMNFKDIRRDMTLVALAGPASNLLIAAAAAGLTRLIVELVVPVQSLPPEVFTLMMVMVVLNILLAVFNMIPLPPLDGHRLLPLEWQAKLQAFGPIFLLLIIFVLFQPLYDWLIEPLTNAAVNFMFDA